MGYPHTAVPLVAGFADQHLILYRIVWWLRTDELPHDQWLQHIGSRIVSHSLGDFRWPLRQIFNFRKRTR